MVKISKKMIQISLRKGHVTDNLRFVKLVVGQRLVHFVFDSVPFFAPLSPNGLSDWPKNYPSCVRGCCNTSVKKWAETLKNFRFKRNFSNVPFFFGPPCI